MKFIVFVFMIMSAIYIAGCSSDNEEELFGSVDPDPGTPSVVSLSTDIIPIIDAKCAFSGCHVAGAQFPNLSVKSNIISQASRIKTRTRSGGGMPRTGSITNTQRNLIGDWVDQGALDN